MSGLYDDPEVRRTHAVLEEALHEHVRALSAANGETGVIVTDWVACAANMSNEAMQRDLEENNFAPSTGYSYLGAKAPYHSRLGLAKELLQHYEGAPNQGERD